MFIGNFKYSIDSKGRISIPAKMRRYLNPDANDSFIITRGMEKCLEIHPLDLWKELYASKLKKLNSYDPVQARFLRMLLQEAAEDKLDSQNRLLIPKNLIQYAAIESEVLILGAMDKIEVWNPKIYQGYLNETSLSYEDIAKEVMTE